MDGPGDKLLSRSALPIDEDSAFGLGYPLRRLLQLLGLLAVADEVRIQGIGTALVTSCLAEADRLGISDVFTLTYQPIFFERLGFHPIDKKELPHKVWSDCLNCPKFPDCNEDALIWHKETMN